MVSQGRVVIIWLFWLIAGICGVCILLAFICYCRLMPRLNKSFDEEYLEPRKDYHCMQKPVRMQQDCTYARVKQTEVHRYSRPVSYGGPSHHYAQMKYINTRESVPQAGPSRCYVDNMDDLNRSQAQQYASYGMLDEIDENVSMDALKTRSLPALRPKQKPLSNEDDLQHLYAEIGDCITKKYKRRMRNEHAAIIALSKSHSQSMDANAVVVYDQRTAL